MTRSGVDSHTWSLVKYHKVSVLYFLEERSLDEIAGLLGRPPKTVETQLYRARKKLKAILTERGIFV